MLRRDYDVLLLITGYGMWFIVHRQLERVLSHPGRPEKGPRKRLINQTNKTTCGGWFRPKFSMRLIPASGVQVEDPCSRIPCSHRASRGTTRQWARAGHGVLVAASSCAVRNLLWEHAFAHGETKQAEKGREVK